MSTKHNKMAAFWSQRATMYRTDPKANANDTCIRDIEVQSVERILKDRQKDRTNISALDFGCANGFSTARLAQMFPSVAFTGVDINPDMIEAAETLAATTPGGRLGFKCADILETDPGGPFDLIFAIRAFQNMDSAETQKQYARRVYELLGDGGYFLFIESYLDGHLRINEDRVRLGLQPLPDHAHLTRLTDAFDDFVAGMMTVVTKDNPFSSYYLVTRLAYSWWAEEAGEAIDYDHALHRVAPMLPSLGDYGPLRLRVYRKD